MGLFGDASVDAASACGMVASFPYSFTAEYASPRLEARARDQQSPVNRINF
jgi:hypothetical protein